MFFNKENVRVIPKADTDLILNVESKIPFYISEVISSKTINQVAVQAYSKDLKTETNLNSFIVITANVDGDYEYTFTPTGTLKSNLYFRFKITIGDNIHIVDSTAFTVINTGVV